MATVQAILTLNSGSSSLKAALYQRGSGEAPLLTGRAERIGLSGASLLIKNARGEVLAQKPLPAASRREIAAEVLSTLKQHFGAVSLCGVGHRIVHGGPRYVLPQLVTSDVLDYLQTLVPLAPEHLPHALDTVAAAQGSFPGVRQVGCFDTAFHRSMPEVAQRYALPRDLQAAGIMRYGFHGLSYEFILDELKRIAAPAAQGRVIVAHLGNGSSMAAVRAGKGIDTTMGFTPAGGLVMSTRLGDVDPGVMLYLMREKKIDAENLDRLVNKKSGLLGVSQLSPDMKDLLAAESSNPAAREAIDLFCYQARKFIGALSASLGGLDTLVFTGGIGENSAPVRERICAGLEYLGVRVETARNQAHAPVLSPDGSGATVRVIRTDEERMIARHTAGLVG